MGLPPLPRNRRARPCHGCAQLVIPAHLSSRRTRDRSHQNATLCELVCRRRRAVCGQTSQGETHGLPLATTARRLSTRARALERAQRAAAQLNASLAAARACARPRSAAWARARAILEFTAVDDVVETVEFLWSAFAALEVLDGPGLLVSCHKSPDTPPLRDQTTIRAPSAPDPRRCACRRSFVLLSRIRTCKCVAL